MRWPGQTRRLLIVVVGLTLAIFLAWLSSTWAGDFAFRRGLEAKREWQLSKAINYFTWARRLKRSNVAATLELGLCEQLRGDFTASQNHLQSLTTAEFEDKSLRSRLHNAIGVNHYSFNEPDAAITSHQKALEFARSAGDRRLEAEALIDLSRAYYHSKGKFYDALAHLEQAHAIGKQLADERIQAAALRNLGVIYWWFKGELDRPLNEFYVPALDLYRRQNDQRGAATMLTLIALVYNNKGDIYQFLRYQNEGVEIQERIGDQAGLADSYMTLGILYNGTANYRKARDYFTRGLAITERTGYRLAGNDLNSLLADVHVHLEEYDEALKLYDPDLKHKDESSALSNYVLQYIAHCYQLKRDYEQARVLYERALKVHAQSETPDVRFRSNTLLRVAECSIALGDWPRASEYWARAKQEAEKGEVHSEGEIRTALVAGTIARHDGRHDDALKYLRHALDVEAQILASAKTNLLIPPHRLSYELLYAFLLDYSTSTETQTLSQQANKILFGFQESRRYRSLRNFLVQIREKPAVAQLAREQERELHERIRKLNQSLTERDHQRTRDQLRTAYHQYEELTLKTHLQDSQYQAISAAKPIELSEFQQALAADTALVEFVFVGEKVVTLLITRNTFQAIELPISKTALATKVKLFRSLVFTDDVKDSWTPVAQSLHENLIEPLKKSGALDQVSTLCLVPYSFLHDLPFAALARFENGRTKFLIEDYVLFQSPSATYFGHRLTNTPVKPPARRTLAFGRNRSSDSTLPPLRFAADEAQAVAQATGGVALINQKATETELKRTVSNYDYLHLATHGVAESDMPLLSRILLEPTATDDGNLTVREIFELGLQANLVTLSACDTGRSYSASGNDFGEQDRLGLMEAFLHAGSQGVIASLFPISDRATTEFMKHFYTAFQNHQTKAEALAATQRAVLRGQIPLPDTTAQSAPAHPRFWAQFILVGDPR